MKFVPLSDRVLILPIEEKREIEGVSIPDAAKQDFKIGVVLAVGEEVTTVEVEDRVAFGPYAGKPIQLDGTECLSMRAGEIDGKIIP